MADRIAVMADGPPPAGRHAPGGLRRPRPTCSSPVHRQPADEHAARARSRPAGGGPAVDVGESRPGAARARGQLDGRRGRLVVVGVRPEHLVPRRRPLQRHGAGRRVARPRAPGLRRRRRAPGRSSASAGPGPPRAGDIDPSSAEPAHVHLFDPDTHGAAGMNVLRRPGRPGYRKESGLALLFLAAVDRVFVVFFYRRSSTSSTGARSRARQRRRAASRWASSQYHDALTGDDFRDGPVAQPLVRGLHGAGRPRARHPAGRRRPPPAQGHQGLPDDLQLDGGQLGGGHVGRVLLPVQPGQVGRDPGSTWLNDPDTAPCSACRHPVDLAEPRASRSSSCSPACRPCPTR